MVTPAARREAVALLRSAFEMSERRACTIDRMCADDGAVPVARPDDAELRERMKALAHERRRFGYRRLHVLLRREGYVVNHKRLFRLYREERLMVRRRGGRKRAMGTRAPMLRPASPNDRWSLDFVSDQFLDGRRFRILSVVDDCTPRVPGAGRRHLDLRDAGGARTGPAHRRARQAQDDRQRQRHRADLNAILTWADENKVGWHYIAPGKPMQNAFVRASTAACATSC